MVALGVVVSQTLYGGVVVPNVMSEAPWVPQQTFRTTLTPPRPVEVDQAVKAFQSGDYDRAVELLAWAYKKYPFLYAESTSPGCVLFPPLTAGEPATWPVQGAAPEDPSRSAAGEAVDEFLRGRFYVAKNELDQALAHLSKSIQIDSRRAEVYVARGEIHLARGNHQKAMEDFSRAVELDPKSAAAHRALGHGHLVNKQWAKALAELTRAIELDPQDYSAYAARAFAHLNLGDRPKAFADHDVVSCLIERAHAKTIAAVLPPLLKAHPELTLTIKAQCAGRPIVPIETDAGMLLDAWERRRMLKGIYFEWMDIERGMKADEWQQQQPTDFR